MENENIQFNGHSMEIGKCESLLTYYAFVHRWEQITQYNRTHHRRASTQTDQISSNETAIRILSLVQSVNDSGNQ